MIWFALLLPVISALYLAKFWEAKMVWWEFLIAIVPTILCIVIFKYSSESMVVKDVETWGNVLTQAHYYEDWDEEVPCRHEIPCSHTKYCEDSDGKEYSCGTQHSNDGYYHSYDVDYHSAYWEAIDDENNIHSISESQYRDFVKRWGNKPYFTDLHRDYHSNDGDKWSVNWPSTYETHEFIASEHIWVNKIAKTDNSLRLPSVTKEEIQHYRIFEYPKIVPWKKMPGILADSGIYVSQEAQKKINWLNGSLGHKKEVRVWVLIFKNQTSESAYKQECLWQRGKQNEFTICISVDDTMKIQWASVFSWTDAELLKVEVRNYLQLEQKKLNLPVFIDVLYDKIDKQYIRKDFEQFNYLTVETPTWAVITTFVITILVNIGLGFWCVSNEFTRKNPTGDGFNYS